MQGSFRKGQWLLIAGLVAAGTVSIAWFDNNNSGTRQMQQVSDTIPKPRHSESEKRTRISGDLDAHFEKLDEAMSQLEKLRSKDWEKMKLDMKLQLEHLNEQHIDLQMEKALRHLESEKLRLSQMNVPRLDLKQLDEELKRALAEAKTNIDSKKLERQIEEAKEQSRQALKEAEKIDMKKVEEELNRAMEELKEQQIRVKVDLQRAQEDIKAAMSRDYEADLNKARADIERAKTELKAYKEMIADMEKQGLINSKDNYKIEYKDGELFINGRKQSAETRDKYKKYFKKEDVRIQRDADNDDWI